MLEKPNREYKEYSHWKNMRARCSAPSANEKRNYITKGITVCEAWDSFETFYNDMGPKPFSNASIDREDNDKGYYKENCRWATPTTQSRNRSEFTKTYTYNGVTGCLPEIAEHANCEYSSIRKRLEKGQTLEEAIHSLKSRYITYGGLSKTKKEWAIHLGVKPSTMFARFKTNKPLAEILK